MYAERIILETDEKGRFVEVPPLPPCARIEAILLVLDTAGGESFRTPPPELAAMTEICGDLVSPVVDLLDWEALR
jgi:hypothetical protein